MNSTRTSSKANPSQFDEHPSFTFHSHRNQSEDIQNQSDHSFQLKFSFFFLENFFRNFIYLFRSSNNKNQQQQLFDLLPNENFSQNHQGLLLN